MLAALWRESPLPQLKSGQRLMTMAALLHVDAQGTAFLPELIKLSGIGVTAWLKRYLDCYLSPLLHCLYAYDLAFMPHGENLILVLEDNVPVRAIMKDIAEEAAIMDYDSRQGIDGRPRFAKRSVDDCKKEMIAAIDPDLIEAAASVPDGICWRGPDQSRGL